MSRVITCAEVCCDHQMNNSTAAMDGDGAGFSRPATSWSGSEDSCRRPWLQQAQQQRSMATEPAQLAGSSSRQDWFNNNLHRYRDNSSSDQSRLNAIYSSTRPPSYSDPAGYFRTCRKQAAGSEYMINGYRGASSDQLLQRYNYSRPAAAPAHEELQQQQQKVDYSAKSPTTMAGPAAPPAFSGRTTTRAGSKAADLTMTFSAWILIAVVLLMLLLVPLFLPENLPSLPLELLLLPVGILLLLLFEAVLRPSLAASSLSSSSSSSYVDGSGA